MKRVVAAVVRVWCNEQWHSEHEGSHDTLLSADGLE
jgi:hypothetical protein